MLTKVRIRLTVFAAALLFSVTLALLYPANVNSNDSSNPWCGTYVSNLANVERNVEKLIIGETQTKTGTRLNVRAWLTGKNGLANEEIFIDNGTVESYMDLDCFPKSVDDTLVASFPSVQDRPIMVMTIGPYDGKHFKYVNVTCYWGRHFANSGGSDAFYVKRRLYRK